MRKHQRAIAEINSVGLPGRLFHLHGQAEFYHVAVAELSFDAHKAVVLTAVSHRFAVDADAVAVAPSGNTQHEGQLYVAVGCKAEAYCLAERIVGVLGDGVGVAFGGRSAEGRRAVEGCHHLTVVALEPHTRHVVWQQAVDVSRTALRLVRGAIGHPRRAVLEVVVV